MATPRRKRAAGVTRAGSPAIRRALLAWYDSHARSLPWRDCDDPYRVWISEIMLQQTRVETVIPYYERWLDRFPTVAALAAASVDDVLHAWQGLGYYSRARNLHLAARVLRERHAGELPHDTASLRALPGIGAYTAGAIASIAYGRAEPAVDGNVRRVCARLLDEPTPGAARVRSVVARLVPPERPGDFNQALMELGATLCTPRRPRCADCPLRRFCRARRAGTQHDRPAAKARTAAPRFTVGTAAIFDAAGRLLFVQRPNRGLLARMWTLPGEELDDGERPEAAAGRAAASALAAAHPLECVGEIGEFRHAFSHRREVYRVFAFRWAGAAARRGAFADASQAAQLAIARASVRMAAACFAWHADRDAAAAALRLAVAASGS